MAGRRLTIAALSLAAGVLAGCGGSGPPPRYAANGDAICARQLAALHRLPQPTTPEQAVSYLPHALTIMARERAGLQALAAPAGRRAALTAALSDSRQLAAILTHFLRHLRSGMVELDVFSQVQRSSDALRAQLDADFRHAGLGACAT
jgi:hypothetical protein